MEIRTAAGIPVARDTPFAPTPTVELVAPLDPGAYTVVVTTDGATTSTPLTIAPPLPIRVEVQPRPGGAWIDAAGTIPVPLVEGGSVEVLVGVTGGPGMPAAVPFVTSAPLALGSPPAAHRGETPAPDLPRGAAHGAIELSVLEPAATSGTTAADPAAPDHVATEPALPLPAPGTRAVRPVRLSDAPVTLTVGPATFTLAPAPVPLADLARDVTLARDVFPAEADGSADLGRPASRVSLPSPLWERVIRAVGLGGRRRDDVAPWAWWGATFDNAGDTPVDLHLTLEVRGPDGAPAPAFRPRLRAADGDTGTVAALLRVPARGHATAALPVFVDSVAVAAGAYTVDLAVTPLGGDTPLLTTTRPLYVRRGDPVASAGFGLALLAFAGGATLLAARLRRWLDAAATSELMTVALFGSALFLVGTAADLVAMGVGAVLGPLSTLLTGLLSDLGRYTLLATLVSLLPRPGTLTLAILTGWFLRGFTTGAFSPTDVLYTGLSIGIAELFAWLAGLTRGGAWRDAPTTERWARLSVGFAGASICTTLCGIWMHTVLARLFFAPWYVALQVLVPAGLYVVIACRVAADFAASLRRVEA